MLWTVGKAWNPPDEGRLTRGPRTKRHPGTVGGPTGEGMLDGDGRRRKIVLPGDHRTLNRSHNASVQHSTFNVPSMNPRNRQSRCSRGTKSTRDVNITFHRRVRVAHETTSDCPPMGNTRRPSTAAWGRTRESPNGTVAAGRPPTQLFPIITMTGLWFTRHCTNRIRQMASCRVNLSWRAPGIPSDEILLAARVKLRNRMGCSIQSYNSISFDIALAYCIPPHPLATIRNPVHRD